MYAELIRSRLPHDERLGLFVSPHLPAVKLGKILMNERRIKQPGDVVAMHLMEGFFSSSWVIFTENECFYPNGVFALAEVKDAKTEGAKVKVTVNLKGGFVFHDLTCGGEDTARVISRILLEISEAKSKAEIPSQSYEGFDKKEIAWLKLRDEVMRTIDMLFEKFNDGKISLIDYEEKKQELLNRL
jgi:hypothetical protein